VGVGGVVAGPEDVGGGVVVLWAVSGLVVSVGWACSEDGGGKPRRLVLGGVCREDGSGDLAASRCRLCVCPENGGGDFAASGGCGSSEDGGGGSPPRSGVPLAPCMARCEHSRAAAVVGGSGNWLKFPCLLISTA